ncbi:MAG TPA: DUF899 domain-containing protein [Longimicrobium sp.]|nr:DUF899 domain-containing protein [Longimicrobium sp.]
MCPACLAALAAAAAGAGGLAAAGAGIRRVIRRGSAAPSPIHNPENTPMNASPVVSREEWLAARTTLLAREKELTRLRDALAEERRRLPRVAVEKDYVFQGPDGPVPLLELFGPHPQLVVYHFMFDPAWEQGCKSCSYVMDNVSGGLAHLGARDTAFAAVSRAPLDKLQAFRARMGWTFPWYTSAGTTFNYDYHVTIDPDAGSTEYNYEPTESLARRGALPMQAGEWPGMSVFVREGDRVFHTYSTYTRGLDQFMNTYNLLDLTPLGRNETDGIMRWIRHHDQYV